MLKKGTVKKGRYKFIKYRTIRVSNLYEQFKGDFRAIELFHKKYPHPLLFSNTPICLTAQNYMDGVNVLENPDDEPFVQRLVYHYRLDNTRYKIRSLKRLIRVIKSIKECGYCKGRHRHSTIGVVKGVDCAFGKASGFALISGKHRAAAVVVLGYQKIKVGVWQDMSKSKRGK